MMSSHCDVFTGFSGKLIVIGLTSLAFISYTSIYLYRRFVTNTEQRSYKVYFLDLSKMGGGQLIGFVVNLLNAHRNASSFDPLSHYFPTFLADEIFGVPLGVYLGRVVNRIAMKYEDKSTFAESLCEFGRYSEIELGNIQNNQESSKVKLLWWFNQLCAWMVCVFISRVLAGAVVPFCFRMFHYNSPFYIIAQWIYELEWSCDTKRYVFAGLMRVVIDLIQIAFVDYWNKARTLYSHSSYSSQN